MTMASKTVSFALILGFIIIPGDAKKSTRIADRVNILERRMNSESNIRSQDIAMILSKIDDLDEKINESLQFRGETFPPNIHNGITNDEKQSLSETTAEELKYDILQLYRAFAEEKELNAEMRNILPGMRDKLNEIENGNNEILKEHQQYLAHDNQKLNKALQSIVESFTFRFLEDHKKYDELKSEYTALKEEMSKINNRKPMFSSCCHALRKGWATNGVYEMQISAENVIISVYCDQVRNNGGWIVFQRRMDGSEDFHRGWSEYKRGFGNLETEFWLGNEFLHEITASGKYELRIDMEDFDGNKAYAEYNTFKIHGESDKYKLEVRGYQGNSSDSLIAHHNLRKFSTDDNDNDDAENSNCAKSFAAGWWYSDCYSSNLNGRYYKTGKGKGIIWYHWKKSTTTSLKFIEMKMREKTC